MVTAIYKTISNIDIVLIKCLQMRYICDVARQKGGHFAYDDNFEFNFYSVTAFSKLQDRNLSMQSGFINEILLEILIVFLFFAACFHLLLESISATQSLLSVCCITCLHFFNFDDILVGKVTTSGSLRKIIFQQFWNRYL